MTANEPVVNEIDFSYVSGDYADLPDTYSTTGDGAPFHAVVSDGSQLTLGSGLSLEPDGQPRADALGDLDEGVVEPGQFAAGQTQTFEVDVIGVIPPEGAVLGVWIDWDDSGDFTADEFLSFNVTEGTNVIPVTAPEDYDPNALGARFRLFAGDDLPGDEVDWTDFEGDAINGEVEDYVLFAATAVSVQNISATATIWFTPLLMMSLLIMTGGAMAYRTTQRRD